MVPTIGSEFSRPPTAQEAVLHELRDRITSGKFRDHGQLLQEVIAAELGVSRVPVREALKILVGEGLVTYQPNRGYTVRRLDWDDLCQIYRIRTLLESEVARVAVAKGSTDIGPELDRLLVKMDKARNVSDLQRINRRFHFTIFEAAELPHFIEHLTRAWDRTDQYRAVYYASAEHRALVSEEHRAITEAIRNRDAEELVRLLDEHREHAIARLQEALVRFSGNSNGLSVSSTT